MKKIFLLNIIWLLIIASYTALITAVLFSEKISKLFHPRNYPFFLAALFLLMLMFYRQICSLTDKNKFGSFNLSILIFLIPLITSAAVFIFSDTGITELVRNQSSIYPNSVSAGKKTEKRDLNLNNIIMTDENYFEIYNQISDNLDNFTGKEIEVSGYVFREKHYKKTEIVIARDLMWCCAADIAVIGFYAETEDAENFKENEWIKVKGKLDKHMYHNEDINRDYYIASIKTESTEKTDPPANEYLYPFTGFINSINSDRGGNNY